MFDPPYDRISVAGMPIWRIPDSDKKYRNFLEWWFEVGRLKPDDSQGWRAISGPWVMKDRVKAISAEEWDALPQIEQELIQSWTEHLPVLFYD